MRVCLGVQCLVAVAVAGAGGVVAAATNGTLGSTTTGSVTVTVSSPPPPRLVQILNLDDLTLNNNSPASSISMYGTKTASDDFCVVETTGGSVTVQVSTNTGIGIGGLWRANATDVSGATIPLDFRLTRADNSTAGVLGANNPQNDSASYTTTLSAGVARTSAAECTALGDNMKMHAGTDTLAADGRTYSAVITFVVTPQ
jgi:hypothetical protein